VQIRKIALKMEGNMLLGEIKAEALKLMQVNQSQNISYLDIASLKNDSSVSAFIYAMPGAINRAFDRLYVLEAIEENINPVTNETPDTYDLIETGVPNILLRMIPFFVVGEIYSADEPSLASSCRNQFEASVEEFMRMQRRQQTQVEIVYGVD
jgi:hypothetical protein